MIVVYKDGTQYEGKMHDGKKYGKGILTYPRNN